MLPVSFLWKKNCIPQELKAPEWVMGGGAYHSQPLSTWGNKQQWLWSLKGQERWPHDPVFLCISLSCSRACAQEIPEVIGGSTISVPQATKSETLAAVRYQPLEAKEAVKQTGAIPLTEMAVGGMCRLKIRGSSGRRNQNLLLQWHLLEHSRKASFKKAHQIKDCYPKYWASIYWQ